MAPTSPPAKPGKAKRPFSEDRRVTVRYRCPPATPGRVYFFEDLEFQRAWIQDISLSGAGLLLSKPLDRGQFVTIQIKSPNSNKVYQLPAHAVHATQQSDGDWVVGFHLENPLTEADLDDLL